jgi:hypothetical protein
MRAYAFLAVLVVSTSVIDLSLSRARADVTLTGFATADNQFTASVSRTPNNAGRTFLTGNSWPQTFSGSITLTRSGTYYLHVRAQDFDARDVHRAIRTRRP